MSWPKGATQRHESMANVKLVRVAVAGLEPVVVAVAATGSTWTGPMGGMRMGVRREQVGWVFLRWVFVAPVRTGLAESGGVSTGGYCVSRMVGGLDELNRCGWHVVVNRGHCVNDGFHGGDPLRVANHLDNLN